MAFVQQTKEQTYKFTGSQRECSFMLMCSGFSIFLVIECPVLRTVFYNTTSRIGYFSLTLDGYFNPTLILASSKSNEVSATCWMDIFSHQKSL